MQVQKKKRRKGRGLLWLAGILFLIACFIIYYQLLYKSKTVNSNIFQPVAVLSGHRADVWSVAISPDGTWLASGSVDSTVKVWNIATGKLIRNLKQPTGVTYVTISIDGNYIASAGYDGVIRLWKMPEGDLVKELKGSSETVWSVDFSKDGKTIASGGEDAAIRIWDIESGRIIKTLKGHTRNIWDVKFSPDGGTLASGSFDKTVKIWDANSGALIKTLTGHSEAVVSLGFSNNGKILATTGDDKAIRLWNTADWQLMRTLTVPEHVQAVDFSTDDKQMITSGRDKPAIGEFLQNFFGDAQRNKGVSMRLWNVQTGELLQTFSEHSNDVNDVRFSPDDQWIASGSSDKTVRLWRRTQ